MKYTALLLLSWACMQPGQGSFAADDGTLSADVPRSITVTGTGEVLAKPDMARVDIGVVTQADSASAAVRQSNQAVEGLLRTLDKHGIAEADIQTSNFNVAPQYDYDRPGQAPQLTGYRVTNQLHVAVRQITDLGALLDDAVTAGANQIYDVTFAISDAESLTDSARRRAMADARRKAALYAHEAGAGLGAVLRIEETVDSTPVPQMGFAAMAEAKAVPIAAGQQPLRQQIRVSFALESAK